MDFLSLMVWTLQGANWQRGGGKGQQPARIERPKDRKKSKKPITSAADLAERMNKLKRR